MPKPAWFLSLGMLAMVAAACGGGATTTASTTPPATTPPPVSAPPATSGPPCTPSGTTVAITATLTEPSQRHAFDKECLAAPADTAFKIEFDNEDSELHNVSIYENVGASTVLFEGKLINGPKKVTYNVKPLPAGTYYFRCDVHFLAMNGTFVVAG